MRPSSVIAIISTLHTLCYYPALANPDIFPINDLIACDMYVLPDIQGSGLTPFTSYYTSPGGGGIRLDEGDTIFSSQILYAFDQDAMGTDEECFFIQIINHLPDLTQLGNDTACAFYVLPYFDTPSISGYAGYYTQPNAEGVRYQQGDTIFTSMTLYAYDGYISCSTEKEITIVIHDLPVIDLIPHQYGCHVYTFSAITGASVFTDSTYFLFEGQRFNIGDNTMNSGDVEAIATNGTCLTSSVFGLSVIDEISITPLGDTLICGYHIMLPDIPGQSVTENAQYYILPGGKGNTFLEGKYYNSRYASTIYAFDSIPGTDCKDEQSFTIIETREAMAFNDFQITICSGYKYDMYELLLARNVGTHGHKIYSINTQVLLEPGNIFNTALYPEGTFQFYVVDSVGFPCINDTAIMTIIVTRNCTTEDTEKVYCVHNHESSFLLSTNMINQTGFCLGGYFLDVNFNNRIEWNDKYDLDRSTAHQVQFYYLLEDNLGFVDTSIITIRIVEALELQYNVDQIELCKGDCKSIKINFLDEDDYLVLAHVLSAEHHDIFNYGFVMDSFDLLDEIVICFLNSNQNNTPNNPDTIFLTLSNHEFYFFTAAIDSLKECQRPPEEVRIITREENTFFYTETLCPGEGVIFEGREFNELNPQGEILLTITAANGCDSFIYVNLSFYPVATTIIREEICDQDSVIINCIAYSKTFFRDTQHLAGAGMYGCDSTIIIDLYFTEADSLQIDTSLCEGEILTLADLSFTMEGIYTGVIKKQNLCDSLRYNITIHTIPTEPVDIFWSEPLCPGDTAELIVQNDYNHLLWSTGDTSKQILVHDPGEYSVSIEDDNGCISSESILLQFKEGINVTGQFFYQGSVNREVFFNMVAEGDLRSIQWYPSLGLDCDTCLNPVATLSNSQSYSFIAIDNDGCIDSGRVALDIMLDLERDVFIPNVFRPASSSDENKLFGMFTRGISEKYDLSIFDRWGGLIYKGQNLLSNNLLEGWNGKINNALLPAGVYVYKIILNGTQSPIIGTVTLVR